MKKFYTLLFALMMTSLGFAQGTETFSNIPTISAYSDGNWTGDDGSTWEATKSRSDQTINGKAITLNDDTANAYIQSGTISGGIGDITITTQRKFGGGSGNLDVLINGSSVGTIPYSGSVQTTTISGINVTGDFVIRIDNNIGGSSGGGADRVAVDNISWTAGAPACAAPTTQASAYNTTALGTTSATLNWTDGDGDEVLVAVKEGSAVDEDPTSGTDYTGNTVFGSGDELGTGNYVVQSGSATSSVSITGLSEASTYYVAVYEYNTTDTCYLTPALTGSFTTGCSTPSDVTAFTANEGNTAVDLSWTNGDCYDELLVVAKAGSAVTNSPSGDGTSYTADAAFGSGSDLGSSEFVAYKGTGTSVTVTGLTNGTTYHFEVFARKSTTWSTGVTANAVPNLTYCDPNPSSVDGTGITNVNIGTINNSTVAESGNYGDYSAQSTDLSQGQTVACDITFTTGYAYNTKIWIDYNNDGDFDDLDEEVYSGISASESTTTLNASFTIPISTSLGQYRLRIGSSEGEGFGGTVIPCYTGPYGAYEDYTINVVAALNNDSDTEVYDPTSQVAATTITAASSTTSGTAFDAFGFEVEDQGTTDGEPTNITTMRFVPGPNNTADWTDHIQGVTLLDGNVVSYTPTTSITDTEIVLTFGSPVVVADGTSLEFLLGLYLNTTAIVDGSVIQLQINESASGFETNITGSGLADPFLLGDVVGNDITINVDATELVFSEQASDTELNAAMSPAVTVSGVDANGNLDTDYNLDVDITSTGTLTGSPVTATAVSGIATFSTLTHTIVGSGLVLTADDGALSTIDSTPFEITEPVVGAADLFFSEYVEGNTGNNKYLEIYNGTGTTITLTDYSVEMYSNGSSSASQTEDFTGGFPTTLASGDVIVLRAQNTSEFTGTAYDSGVCFFNGDDTVVLKKNGIIIDIIGNIGCDPGSAFTASGGFSTANKTLVRNTDVCEGVSIDPSGCGSTSFTTLATEWTSLGTDVFSNLGTHTAACGAPTTYTYNGTWSPSDPSGTATAGDDIVIASGNAIIDANTSANSVTVNAGAGLTVDSGVTLTVTNGLLLESSSTSYSSLILDGTITGTLTYERHVNINGSGTTGSNDLISAPLTGQAFDDFVAANSNILNNGTLYLFGPFDKTIGDYVTYAGTATTPLEAGVGYRAASTDNGTFTFTGTANNGTVTHDITNSGPTEVEWNLVGNPYPSYLNVQDFLSHDLGDGTTNLELMDAPTAAIYGYDGSALNGWTIYNLANTTPSTVIAPGQGFFVSADATKAPLYNLEFTPDMRSTGTSDDFIPSRLGGLVFLTLNASTASDSYSTALYFNANASLTFNIGYDSGLPSSIPPFILYSTIVEPNPSDPNEPGMLAIQTINPNDLANTTIPLGVNASQGEQITFSLLDNTTPASTEIYLDDTVAGTSTLLNGTDYVFTPSTTLSGTGRFFLRVYDESLSTQENSLDALSIYALGDSKELVVRGQLYDDTVLNLYDVQGRQIVSTTLDQTRLDNRLDVSTLNSGVYVVTLQNNGQQKTQKVIIK